MTNKEFKTFCLNFLKQWVHIILDKEPISHCCTFRDKGTKKFYRITVYIQEIDPLVETPPPHLQHPIIH